MPLKLLPGKWRPCCLVLNVLSKRHFLGKTLPGLVFCLRLGHAGQHCAWCKKLKWRHFLHYKCHREIFNCVFWICTSINFHYNGDECISINWCLDYFLQSSLRLTTKKTFKHRITVREIYQWQLDSPRKRHLYGVLMLFSLFHCINCWEKSWVAGEMRRDS